MPLHLFLNQAHAIGGQQLLQVGYLRGQFGTLVGVFHHHALRVELDKERGRLDVQSLFDGFLATLEGFVLHQLEAVRVIDQGVAGDARLRLVGFGKATVYHQQLTAGLDGFLALEGLDGDMAVDDVRMRTRLYAKLLQNAVAGFGFVAQRIIPALGFLAQIRVAHEVTLEGGHLVFVERGGVGTAPHIPHIVHGKGFGLGALLAEVGAAHQLVGLLQEFVPPVFLLPDADVLEAAVGVEGHGGVIEQVAVADEVHAAVGVEAAHVLAQLLAVHEGGMDFVHQFALFVRQAVGVGGVDSGEMGVAQGVFPPFVAEDAAGVVYLVQQLAPCHAELGTAVDDGGLEFQLDDGDGLVHLCDESLCLLVVLGAGKVHPGCKHRAGVVAVGIHGKGGQGQKVDAVAVFEGGEVAVAHGQADDVGDAGIVARGGAHPQQVVVAPLDIEVVVVAEGVHDDVGARTAVVDVAHDVQRVDGEALDEVAQGHDEVIRPPGADDGGDDDVDVGLLVGVDARLVEQLLDDVGEVAGQGFAHLRTGVFGRNVLADLDQLVQGDLIPVVQFRLLHLDQLEFLLGIVDERAQLLLLAFAQGVAEDFVHLALDGARAVLQHMLEGFVLAVYICQEVVRAFGQVQ